MLLAWSITAGRGGAGAGSDGKTGGTIVAENQNSNRKNENVRRANRIIQTRSFVLMILMGVVMFVLLFFRLFDLQITRHEELQGKAVNQQTRRTVVTANRGTIYDAGGNILAISSSAETIILSPLEIDNAVNDTKNPVSWTKESLAAGLAEILGKDASAIRKRMDNVKSQYEVIQLRADEDTAAKVRSYVDENKIAGVHLVADTKRYYPYGSLAAQVIGFVGDENTGLYGLEAYYEKELEGQSGLVISSKDQAENDMLYTYEQYFAAKNGSDLTLTLDTTIQYYLEKGIESMVDKFSAANGASGIVMDAKTGGILAMASYPNYDLNDFLTVSDQTLQERIERGESTVADMQLLQWRNKALNDTYEPGSTFKIITLSAALDSGKVTSANEYNCGGSYTVNGERIKCWKSGGHGHETLKKAVQNSCNPAFMAMAQAMGVETFYEYIYAFGFGSSTGSGITGEASGIVTHQKYITENTLARIGFGQSIAMTPLQLVTAVSAVVNGGNLMQPYVLNRIVANDGTVILQNEPTTVRRVIREETSQLVREIAESVVTSGSGRNAAVAGYRIGGKTGTAQKYEDGKIADGKLIASFIGFAPADDPEFVCLILVDEPQVGTVFGSTVAAPFVKQMLEETLRHAGYLPEGSEESVAVPPLAGMTIAEAAEALKDIGLTATYQDDSTELVTAQIPAAGQAAVKGSGVLLYTADTSAEYSTEGEDEPELVTVPDVSGMTRLKASDTLKAKGLEILIYPENQTGKAIRQSPMAGESVPAGTEVLVEFSSTNIGDG